MNTEKDTVYEALRNSIIRSEESISNEYIYMYITYFALLALGSNRELLLFISYIVLIVFQSMINEDRLAISKASTYILVFFEGEDSGIHWESLHNGSYLDDFKTTYRHLAWVLRKISSSTLAFISFYLIAMEYHILTENAVIDLLTHLKIILSTLLMCGVFYVNAVPHRNSEQYTTVLIETMKKFHRECYRN